MERVGKELLKDFVNSLSKLGYGVESAEDSF